MAATHECPAPGCTEQLPQRLYACARHWRSLPADLKRRLRSAWAGGTMDEYLNVHAECEAWLIQRWS